MLFICGIETLTLNNPNTTIIIGELMLTFLKPKIHNPEYSKVVYFHDYWPDVNPEFRVVEVVIESKRQLDLSLNPII